ncbi:hypothetical protein ACFRZ8_004755, partial [Shigella sonnei]
SNILFLCCFNIYNNVEVSRFSVDKEIIIFRHHIPDLYQHSDVVVISGYIRCRNFIIVFF